MARTAAAQYVFVTHAASVADAVEEFEDVDRHLAPAAAIAVNDVAQVGGGAQGGSALLLRGAGGCCVRLGGLGGHRRRGWGRGAS